MKKGSGSVGLQYHILCVLPLGMNTGERKLLESRHLSYQELLVCTGTDSANPVIPVHALHCGHLPDSYWQCFICAERPVWLPGWAIQLC